MQFNHSKRSRASWAWGIAALLAALAGGGALAAPAETVLHSFTGSNVTPIDGSGPLAGLLAWSDGKLFGTTADGGASDNGTVFKLSRDGTLTVLHSFTGSRPDCRPPWQPLWHDTPGRRVE